MQTETQTNPQAQPNIPDIYPYNIAQRYDPVLTQTRIQSNHKPRPKNDEEIKAPRENLVPERHKD